MEKEKLQEAQTRFGYPGGEDVGVLDIFPQKKGYPRRPEDLQDSTKCFLDAAAGERASA